MLWTLSKSVRELGGHSVITVLSCDLYLSERITPPLVRLKYDINNVRNRAAANTVDNSHVSAAGHL